MEYELTCCVCLELYREPVTLPCSHSLCRVCANEISHANGNPFFMRPFSCPTCRFNVQRHHFNELKENKLLSNIVAAYRREKGTTGSVPQMVCYVHPTEQLLLYCQSCKKAICSFCVTETHHKYSHRVSYIEHLVEQEKESVAKLVKETEQNLQEKKEKLVKQQHAILNAKETAERNCSSLMHLLKTRLSKIKSDYHQKIAATVPGLTETERAIESSLTDFKALSTTFESTTYKPDRHLHYKKLTGLGKELSTFSLSVSMNGSLQVEEKQLPKFALSNVDALREAIQALDLPVTNKRPQQDLSLEELIERGLEDEGLRAVFDRVMKKRDSMNIQKSKQVLDVGIQVAEPSDSVTNPASDRRTAHSNDIDAIPSDGQPTSSTAGLTSALITSSSSVLAPTSAASQTFAVEPPQPSVLCEQLKTTLEDFFQSLLQKQSCNADDTASSVLSPPHSMEQNVIPTLNPNFFKLAGTASTISSGLPIPSLRSPQVLQPKQALTSKHGALFGGSVPPQSIPLTSNPFSTTSAPPLFLTSILSSGHLRQQPDSVPGHALSEASMSLSNLSLLSNLERCQQPSLQPPSASLLAPVSFRQPEASTSTFAALERNFLAAPAFSIGASGEEQERSPKKPVKRTSRKF